MSAAAVAEPAAQPLLEVDAISKRFGSVVALREASLTAATGQITAIVGDNGAGKSTLIKCVAGVHGYDSGEIRFAGAPVSFATPEQAREHGIETVYQDLALIEDLSVWQNLFLNRERTIGGPLRLLDRRAMRKEADILLRRLAIEVPSVRARVRRLSGGQRQAVAIARAVAWGSRLVIMDEPTAALGVRETARVEEFIRSLRNHGLTVIVISHNFDQVIRLSDHVWVMRGGRVVAGGRTSGLTADDLVALVTGARQA
jgi:simple sugar transport system ATP-binding protein